MPFNCSWSCPGPSSKSRESSPLSTPTAPSADGDCRDNRDRRLRHPRGTDLEMVAASASLPSPSLLSCSGRSHQNGTSRVCPAVPSSIGGFGLAVPAERQGVQPGPAAPARHFWSRARPAPVRAKPNPNEDKVRWRAAPLARPLVCTPRGKNAPPATRVASPACARHRLISAFVGERGRRDRKRSNADTRRQKVPLPRHLGDHFSSSVVTGSQCGGRSCTKVRQRARKTRAGPSSR